MPHERAGGLKIVDSVNEMIEVSRLMRMTGVQQILAE